MHRHERSPTACASSGSTARSTSRPSSSSATNSRLDAIHAAALRVFLPQLAGWNRARREAAARYAELGLGEVVELPEDDAGHVYHMYVVRTAERDRIAAALQEAGIASASYYVRPLHLQPAMAYLGYAAGLAPGDRAGRRGEPRPAAVGRDRRRAAGAGRRRRSAPRPASPSRQRAPVRSPINRHSLWQVAADAALVALAWWLAWILRFDEARPGLLRPLPRLGRSSLLVVAIKLPVFVFSGFYNRWWRYVSTRDMWTVFRGVVLASIAVFLVFTLFDVHRAAVPRGVWFIDLLLCLAFVAGSRLLARTLIERPLPGVAGAARTWSSSARATPRSS